MAENPQHGKEPSRNFPDPPAGYRFGIELEYRLKVRNHINFESVYDACRHLADLWNAENQTRNGGGGAVINNDTSYIPMEANLITGQREYDVWNLVEEPTMTKPDDPQIFRVEVISPIFLYSKRKDWENHIQKALDFIEKHTEVGISYEAGLHIHVSPDGPDWELPELQRISAAICHFDEGFRQKFPEHNFTQKYLKSNFKDNARLKNLQKMQACQAIYATETKDELINMVNAVDENYTGFYPQQTQKNYAWNLLECSVTNRCSFKRQTIEFRSPRSSTKLNEINACIDFAVSFIRASTVTSNIIESGFSSDIGGLERLCSVKPPPGGSRSFPSKEPR